MLITFVVAYLLVTIAIGLLAARRVHGCGNFLMEFREVCDEDCACGYCTDNDTQSGTMREASRACL